MNNQTLENDENNKGSIDNSELKTRLRSIWLPLVDVLRAFCVAYRSGYKPVWV
jgi:hypothetical protein